jgi:hypothetical protein
MKRLVTVRLSEFACLAIAGEGEGGGEQAPSHVIGAIRCYLKERDSGGLGWSYPSFLRDAEPGKEVELRLSIEDELWRSLDDEAQRQGVSVQKMVAHAVLYVAAEVDAGRVTRRALDELEAAAS